MVKQEIEALPIDRLPLQRLVAQGSYALDDGRSVMVLSVRDGGEAILVTLGILFTSLIAGCSCADDPTPVEAVNEYCQLQLSLDKQTGMAEISVLE